MKPMREILALWLLKSYTVRNNIPLRLQDFPRLCSWELLQAEGYIWPYISSLVQIRIQYAVFMGHISKQKALTICYHTPSPAFTELWKKYKQSCIYWSLQKKTLCVWSAVSEFSKPCLPLECDGLGDWLHALRLGYRMGIREVIKLLAY